jgi:predicted transcriptional regulator
MTTMSDAISIRLPAGLRRELERLGKRQKRPVSDVAREALNRYVAVERFKALRARTLPLAEAQGLLTDEDVFRLVS